jgi:hypothetical protein
MLTNNLAKIIIFIAIFSLLETKNKKIKKSNKKDLKSKVFLFIKSYNNKVSRCNIKLK